MGENPLLSVRNVVKRFVGLTAVSDVSFDVAERSITGLIGPNGSGKSTLFNCISGFSPCTSGAVTFKGQDITRLSSDRIARIGITRTFQTTRLPGRMTVLETLLAAAPGNDLESAADAFFRRAAIRSRESAKLVRARELLQLVGIPQMENEFATQLSGGQQRLLSIACALFREPDIIMLDEPAAGVNPTLVRQLMVLIKKLRDEMQKTFLIVEHDMHFISGICDKVIVLDAGQKIAEGEPSLIREDERVLEIYLGGKQK